MKDKNTRYSGIRQNSVYRFLMLKGFLKSQGKMAEKLLKVLFLQEITIKKRENRAQPRA